MTAQADPLLVAIERLTKRHKESERLPGGVGMHYADHDALLRQLREAIGGNVGRGGGSAQQASVRTPIDPDAMKRYLDLVTEVRDFHAEWSDALVPVDERPEKTLANAYNAFKDAVAKGLVSESLVKAVTSKWENACDRILMKLSPPTSRELIGFPCPVCGIARARIVTNRSKDSDKPWRDVEIHVALTVTYVPDPVGGGLGKSTVHCAACDTTWTGDHGIRYVAFELDRFEKHAIAIWAEHDSITADEKVRLLAWVDLPLAKREEWMIRAFMDLNPLDPEDEAEDPDAITPDGDVADRILTPTGAPE